MSWSENLLTTPAQWHDLLTSAKTVAVLGIKTEAQNNQPAYYVPAYLVEAGLTVFPVPVYYPDATEILGQKVYRKLVEIPAAVDIVDIFRRPVDVSLHLDDLLATKPKLVWMQAGIAHATVAEALARAGIKVVQDHCLMVEHRRIMNR